MAATYRKDPDAIKDYTINWATYLATLSDTITSSEWEIDEGVGLTIDSDSSTTTTTTVWLSGGTTRIRYRVRNRIVTTGGRTEDQSIFIRIREQ
jgi:hypothetical protein